MKKSKSKHSFKAACAAILIALSLFCATHKSEKYLMNRSIKLIGNQHACSGEQVRAPSGEDYILTAAHCKVLATNGLIEAITEDGRHQFRYIIDEDKESDLLLLQGIPGLIGLDIAESVYRNDEVRTFTHGQALDTYKTTGVLIQDTTITIPLKFIQTQEELGECLSMPKYKVIDLFIFKACALSVEETATTALIRPGSSGGMVLNSKGQLVGVVSAGEPGGFGYLVRLEDIQRFLGNY
jgi:hypothetical protein